MFTQEDDLWRTPVFVSEWDPTPHLVDIILWMVIIGVGELPAELPGKQPADRRLAGSDHSHHNNDHACS